MFGQNALALYRKHKPDVVILDVHLPDSYGPDVAREIRNFDDNARFVFLTNDYKPLAALEAAQAGARGFLSKSVSASAVLEAVKQVAAGARQLPEDLIQDAAILRSAPFPSIEGLTERERAILHALAEGMTPFQIAHELKQPLKRIYSARVSLQRRLGARTVQELVRIASNAKRSMSKDHWP